MYSRFLDVPGLVPLYCGHTVDQFPDARLPLLRSIEAAQWAAYKLFSPSHRTINHCSRCI
jgi:hypothetical protein